MTHNTIDTKETNTRNPGTFTRRIEMLTQRWNRNKSALQAKREGIQFNNNHWEVIKYLRRYYIANGFPANIRTLSDDLTRRFNLQGGNIFLSKLFPGGAVIQGCRIANLPVMASIRWQHYSEPD